MLENVIHSGLQQRNAMKYAVHYSTKNFDSSLNKSWIYLLADIVTVQKILGGWNVAEWKFAFRLTEKKHTPCKDYSELSLFFWFYTTDRAFLSYADYKEIVQSIVAFRSNRAARISFSSLLRINISRLSKWYTIIVKLMPQRETMYKAMAISVIVPFEL